MLLASSLLELEERDFKKIVDMALKTETKPLVPVCIEVEEAQERDRIVEILEHIYGKWPGHVIFIVNTRMIKEALKYNMLDKCLEDYHVPPPDM